MTYRDYNSIQISTKLLTRIFSRITIQNTGYKTPCWLWDKPAKKGYASLYIGKETKYAVHRLMYALFVEPVDPALDCDHLCRVRACINPGHLEHVTRAVNVLRGVSIPAQHAQRTHCVAGHPLSGDNLYMETRPSGTIKRRCRACGAARRRKRTGCNPRRDTSQFCVNGHSWFPDNFYLHGNGKTKICKTCTLARSGR